MNIPNATPQNTPASAPANTPRIHPTATVASSAIIEGNVTVGPNCRIQHGAILNAGDGTITLGDTVIVMEQAVLRATRRFPLSIGDHCLIGPHTSVSGATIESEVFIATGASVFPAARLGRGSEVRINGVVHLRTVLPPASTVPIGWVAVGDPAHILPPGQHEEIWEVQRQLDFAGYVFGVDGAHDDAMVQLTQRYARYLGQAGQPSSSAAPAPPSASPQSDPPQTRHPAPPRQATAT